MNAETATLVSRPYLQLVDDLLTAIVGGVVNEPIMFDVKFALYPLAEPARDLRGVTGIVGGEPFVFQRGVDFEFSEGDNAVVWQEGGTLPDDETTFRVDYFRTVSRSPLTDLNVGSVTRTLTEAIGREIATVYEEINHAYRSGFVDTAKGTALDLVVAILGVTRKTKDYAVGLVTFFRTAGVEGNITIAQGTSLATATGDVVFETTQPRTLQRGQLRIDVPVRAAEAFRGEAGEVPAGAIVTLAQPIAGIERVTNFDPTVLGAEDETDAELQDRAKAALRALGKATLQALLQVVFESRATLVEARDPNSPPLKRSRPGSVALLVNVEPERFAGLLGSVHETRAAGVEATVAARYVFFKPRVVGRVAPGLTAAGKEKVVTEAIAAMQAYVDGLSGGEPASGSALLEALSSVEDLAEARFVDVIAWRSDLGDPAAEGLVDQLVEAVTTVPSSDPEALRDAIAGVVAEAPPVTPGARRIPDRGLVQGAAGRATDAEIESGAFSIVPVEAEWFVVLDVEPADIALEEVTG